MINTFKPLAVGAFCLLNLVACAPPGYETAAFVKVKWPTSDQAISLEQRIEIEGRLKALKYLSDSADGVLTKSTRLAIRSFQTDIGAPATGFVSVPLLDALQTNSAFLTASELQQVKQGVIVQSLKTRPAAQAQNRTTPSDDVSIEADGGGDGGGAGGAGAGAWN